MGEIIDVYSIIDKIRVTLLIIICYNCLLYTSTSDEDTTIEATRKSDASVHTHTYGVWSNDDADHWHECTDAACTDKAGSVKDKAGHVYDDDADTTLSLIHI